MLMISAAAQDMNSMGAASIQAGTQILQGVLDRDFQGGQSSKARQFSIDDRAWRRDAFTQDRNWSKMWSDIYRHDDQRRADTKYQRLVLDARNAGLHPLFALGGGMAGGSGGSYFGGGQGQAPIPGSPAGGSATHGVAAAGRAVAEHLMGKHAAQMAERRLDSQIRVDDANVNYLNSLAAKAAQEANGGPRMTEDGAIVHPLGSRQGIPLIPKPITTTKTARATRVTPHQNSPLWVTAEVQGRTLWALNPDLGLDELSQVIIGAQMAGHKIRKGAIESGLYDPKSPNPVKEPKKYFQYWNRKLRK